MKTILIITVNIVTLMFSKIPNIAGAATDAQPILIIIASGLIIVSVVKITDHFSDS